MCPLTIESLLRTFSVLSNGCCCCGGACINIVTAAAAAAVGLGFLGFWTAVDVVVLVVVILCMVVRWFFTLPCVTSSIRGGRGRHAASLYNREGTRFLHYSEIRVVVVVNTTTTQN